jgi:hypothetical protein
VTRRVLAACMALSVVSGCVKPPPPPPKSVHTIAVFPPHNQTRDDLLISGGSVLEKYVFHTARVTVPDVLAAEARTVLERHGYMLVSPELVEAATSGRNPASAKEAAELASQHGLAGDVLYIDLRQWEPDLTYGPSSIIVSMRIDLLDTKTGRTLWSADHPPRPVQTPATINFADAYWVAARTVVRQMLEPFGARHAER